MENVYSQNFDALTSQIFFDGNIKSRDSVLLTYFKERTELKEQKDSGWIMYPPINEKGESLPYFRFTFTKHPYIQQDFESGGIMAITSAQKVEIIGLTIGFAFTSKEASNKVYNYLTRLYGKYASQVSKRDVAEPFKVTKYIDNKGDFIIITKGENIGDDNKPYIHIAYNFQDYVW